MQISEYSKIYQLGHRATRKLFDGGPLVVQEKVDGSQFSFANVEGTLRCRSRNNPVGTGGNSEGMFARAVKTAEAVFATGTMPEGMVVRGEMLDKLRHNVLRYERTPIGGIIIYDIELPQRSGNYLSSELVQSYAGAWGLEVVPTFAYEPFTMETLRAKLTYWLEKQSILGGTKIEGVVIKNYRERDEEDNVLMAKYVSEAFKEKMDPSHTAKPEGTIVEQILAECGKEAIWAKAVQHLRDAGQLVGDPKDIGKLVTEIKSDFEAERGEEIRSRIAKFYFSEVIGGVLTGFPQWYKEKLIEDMEKE